MTKVPKIMLFLCECLDVSSPLCNLSIKGIVGMERSVTKHYEKCSKLILSLVFVTRMMVVLRLVEN